MSQKVGPPYQQVISESSGPQLILDNFESVAMRDAVRRGLRGNQHMVIPKFAWAATAAQNAETCRDFIDSDLAAGLF